jgi:hypothetical protein
MAVYVPHTLIFSFLYVIYYFIIYRNIKDIKFLSIIIFPY